MKRSRLAYNRRETRDKWPLGRHPDRSWCHLHTILKLFWFAVRDSMDFGVLVFCRRFPWSHGLRPKKLYTSVEVTPALVRVPTQRSLVPSFHTGKAEKFSLNFWKKSIVTKIIDNYSGFNNEYNNIGYLITKFRRQQSHLEVIYFFKKSVGCL